MEENASVLDADLHHAVSMVQLSFVTLAQAPQSYSPALPTRQTALGESAIPHPPGRPVPSRSLNTWVPV